MNRTRTMRVKVPVGVLIASAERQRAAIIKQWEKDQANVDREVERWKTKALAALAKAVQDIQVDALDIEEDVSRCYGNKNRSRLTVEVRAPYPTIKSENPDTKKVDQDLALLRACSDTELSIGTDDNFARYL